MKPSNAVHALLLVLVLHASVVSAQFGEIRPGVRIRVDAPGVVADRLDATVISSTADTLMVASPDMAPLAVPVSRITSLEISRGRSRTKGAIFGAEIGGGIAVAFGLATMGDRCGGCKTSYQPNAVSYVLEGVSVYAVTGAMIGAIAGRERWESFDLRQRTSIGLRNGRPTLAMTIPL
jgi:hypothetical protein